MDNIYSCLIDNIWEILKSSQIVHLSRALYMFNVAPRLSSYYILQA